MAYAPTTWDANDVITKDKLNKIEQGINTASKLSGTDIDTDKNWGGKNITNVNQFQAASADLTAITTSRYTLVSPSGSVCYADNSTKEQKGYTETVAKTAPPVPAGRSGTVTVHCNLKTSSTSYKAYIVIRRNGVQVANFSTSSTSFELRSADVTVSPGDVISMVLQGQSNGTATNSLFEIRAITLPGIVNSFTW